MSQNDILLEVEDLRTVFDTSEGAVRAVDGVDVTVRRGECLGVVGESGSGKSVTFSSVMGLVRAPGRIAGGRIRFDGRDLIGLGPRDMRAIRGRDISMTMQDALTALNPALTVGEQLAEMLNAHDEDLPARGGARRRAIREKSVEMLRLVGIPSPDSRLGQYPHEFSGGMRQRIMIAIALAPGPKLLIADEPTTALDVTIQAQVLELISDIRARLGMSVVLITHDLGVVAEHCDRVMVMYAGQVVEEGATVDVIANPRHPYTRGLLASIPRLSMRGQPIRPIEGQVPNLVGLPPQCRFYSRCPERMDSCLQTVAMRPAGPGRRARCIAIAEEAVA
ncbi:ABC transporter ATP-binding protein [Stappia indica]|uniref:ABC transporter ATP-binding protein n=1 Tax=Stappia indica TaxID=538381 RepID=UPI001CD4149A|nr:ABC transporter ATP-binding protein [Stappia indica]MCA1298057.1 ABC transporter ATP-binding protein [Stappia indica]